jgi:hypothetical protein
MAGCGGVREHIRTRLSSIRRIRHRPSRVPLIRRRLSAIQRIGARLFGVWHIRSSLPRIQRIRRRLSRTGAPPGPARREENPGSQHTHAERDIHPHQYRLAPLPVIRQKQNPSQVVQQKTELFQLIRPLLPRQATQLFLPSGERAYHTKDRFQNDHADNQQVNYAKPETPHPPASGTIRRPRSPASRPQRMSPAARAESVSD